MRALIVIALLAGPASADGISILARRHAESGGEPLLHLDTATANRADAEGGFVDRSGSIVDIGRVRIAVEGTWWLTGLAPSMFAEDLTLSSWRAAGEISYGDGRNRIGANTSTSRYGVTSHRMVGLFASHDFRISRWMRASIIFGIAFEEWTNPGLEGPLRGTSAGLTFRTTFR